MRLVVPANDQLGMELKRLGRVICRCELEPGLVAMGPPLEEEYGGQPGHHHLHSYDECHKGSIVPLPFELEDLLEISSTESADAEWARGSRRRNRCHA